MGDAYRYIIIGSGVAGVTIAKLLLEKDALSSILILEAGPRVAMKDRRSWWDYTALSVYDEQTSSYRRSEKLPYDWTYDQNGECRQTGNPGWTFEDSRMIAFGGSTMHWGGWALRHKPEDFEMYSRTRTGADWPFSYEALEKYYCMAEEYLSVCGDSDEDWGEPKMWRSRPYPMPPFQWTAPESEMADAFRACNIQPGRMPIARFRKCLTTGTCKYCPLGSRFSAAQVLDDLIRDERYPNLVLRCNSPTTQIIVESKHAVRGVEFLDAENGDIKQSYADVVILCAGTYESPKLLLLSQSPSWEKGIGNDHELVGRYLVTHAQLKVKGQRQGNAERWFQEYDFPTLMSRTYDSPEHQEKGKIFLYNNRKLPNIDFASLMIAGKSRQEIDAALIASRQTELEAFFEDKGRRENFLTIDGTRKTRFGLPMTAVTYNRTTVSQQAIEEWRKVMENVVTRMGYEIIRGAPKPPGGHHATGTCRMGTSPENSVTDENLRVHDIDNLFICSNATFPTSTAVNPTLTLTALAFRLVDTCFGGVVRSGISMEGNRIGVAYPILA